MCHRWHIPEMQPPELIRIDDRLATLGRGLGAMRLRIGEGLLRLETRDGIRALGFPSLEAYACEVLGRTGRWGSDVRALARRLSALPRLRSALVTGALSSSMVELVSRVATPDDDGAWVERAGHMTVRGMRAYLKTDRIEIADDEMPERVAITTTVDRIDAWAVERARLMVEAVGARRGDEAIEAMLAEGLTEILARDPDVDLPAGLVGTLERESRAFRAELAAIHETAEARAGTSAGKRPRRSRASRDRRPSATGSLAPGRARSSICARRSTRSRWRRAPMTSRCRSSGRPTRRCWPRRALSSGARSR